MNFIPGHKEVNFKEFYSTLNYYEASHVVFVGLGNEFRKDDAAGLLFLKELSSVKQFKESYFIRAERNPENFLEIILRYEPKVVVFIDAADWEGTPGEIKWLNQEELAGIKFSTHTFSIKLIEQYLSAFKDMDFLYLGIQLLDEKEGTDVSPEITKALKTFFKGTEIV